MEQLDLSEGNRLKAVQAVKTFLQRFEPGKTSKGLYLHGGFGVGKTYLMGAVANSLARRKQVHSLMVYTPDFFRDMKTSIQNQTVNEKIDYIKKIPLLILDDIGAETISPWIRDDVLGTVLQYRMMEKLPTMYTSNWDYDELEKHLAYSQKYDAVEEMKAKRIMERIRHLTLAVEVAGENRRS
jgi:primosomal protein DnaI